MRRTKLARRLLRRVQVFTCSYFSRGAVAFSLAHASSLVIGCVQLPRVVTEKPVRPRLRVVLRARVVNHGLLPDRGTKNRRDALTCAQVPQQLRGARTPPLRRSHNSIVT